uniref:Poly [ADP-ribose] polymerase n=1 Tax=Oryzias sinensis TaxID=183150 RepID=A0A8C7ZG84_9TELE
MAAEYSHRVVVELESGDVPKVKNKLVKYFQSRRSGGGDCQVDYEEGSRSAVLRFSREEDKKKVLDKETHQVQLEKGVLKMTARLPPEEQTAAQVTNDAEIPKQELTDEADRSPDTEEEELCSTSAVLENISAETSQEFLEMLVENVLKGLRLSSQKFSLETLPEISSAVVTFQTGADNSTFIKACPQNRMFNRKRLMVRSLEMTKQVVINNENKFNADVLQLYFDGKGGGVEDVLLNEEEQSAVITFTEPKGVRDVLKEKHNFKNKEIKVYPFYESLGVALYGKDKKILKLPATISEPLESAVFTYLKQNPAALESIHSDLEKHFCNVALDQAAVCLEPKPLLLKQKDSKTLIREWTNTVKGAFTQTMSKFKSTTFQLKPEAVEESERAIRQTLLKVPDEVILVPDKAQGVLSVAGLVDNVNALEEPIQEVINKTAQRVERQKLSKTQEVKVSPTVFQILCQDGFEDKLLSLFPELQMSFNKEKSALKVTGLVDEIFAVTKTINDSSFSLKRQSLDMEETLLDFLKGGEEVELTNSLLTAYDINAALEISANRVQLIAASEEDLMDAQEHLRQLLTSKGFVVEDADVLKMEKWKELVRQMEDENNSSGSRIQIQTTDQQVVVCGHKDLVEKVSFTLEEFLRQNACVDETVHVKANVIIKYFGSPEMPWLTELQKQVNVSFQKNTIHLSGSRAAVEEAKMSVETMLSSLVFDSLMVNKPGGKKFFLEKENMYLSSLKSETGCLVQLVDDLVQGLEDAAKQEFVKTKEGLRIILKKGNIEASKVTPLFFCLSVFFWRSLEFIVTVNTIFSDLALNRGAVSTAILNVAGPKLQQLVTAQKATGTEGEIIITDGCNLKSQKVFHAVATKWDNGKGTAEQVLSGIFKGCLEKAENGNLTSISIPAIGTGNLGFPKTLVASLMLDKIVEFCSQAQPKHLKRVEIVIFAGDAPTIQEFTKEFMRKFPNASVGTDIKSSSQTTGPFSKVTTSSTGMHETTMGNVTIQVVTGDITKETTDVIVNSSDEKFTLKSGVSKAILDAAGQAVEQECQTCGAQPNSGMILTQPGNLKCKKILHLTGQTDPVKVQKVVKDALEMCAKQSFTSVSFPAIGTGQGNVQAGKVADAMLDAVIDVLSQNPSSTLKTVRIIIFQQQMLKDFYNSMQQREAGEQQEKAKVPSSIGQRLKSLLLRLNEGGKKEDDISIVPVKPDPACFHICGGTQSKVNAAKKWITDLISNEQTTIPITDNAILDLTKADCQHINGMQKKMGVTIQMENKNSQTSLIVEGLSRDVIKALREIDDILKKVKSKQELDKLVELTGAVADWQYQLQGKQFQSFDPMTNYELEQAMQQELPSVNVKVQGQDYAATLPEGPATDKKGNTLQIKRIDKLRGEDIPEHWQQMPPKTTCLVANVQAGTPEYNEVLQLFQASCKRNVIKIDRIQNPALWRSLQIKKSELEVRNGHQNNEKRLFHGTSEDTVKIINERGFNRVYAGKNAAYFGNGTYFAVNASYSAQDTYSKPNANGEKIMYLCRVLTGDYTLGQQHMIAPPAKSSLSIELFDSVVDNVANPVMFVIFHDTQAYPEYLITFK